MSRRLDLAMFRGDDSDEEDGILGLLKPPPELDPQKAKIFSLGATRKTKQEIEREAEQKKKREEEEAARLALEEFAREFDNPNAGPSSGQRGRGGFSGRGRGFVRAGEERQAYVPPRAMPSTTDHKTSITVFGRSPSPPPAPKPRGKRAMDAFLEEIKANQEARNTRGVPRGYPSGPGRYDRRDQHHGVQETTNLCIMGLPDDISEGDVGRLFAKVGPVGTVKIMWPRGDGIPTGPRRDRNGLTGFVCYMHRRDAEKALQRFDGYVLSGSALRVSWSKYVPIPSQAAYRQTSPSRSPSPDRRGSTGRRRSRSPHATPVVNSAEREARRRFWLDQIAPDQLQALEPVLRQIHRDGSNYLNALKEAEKDNVKFAFLLDQKTPEYHLIQSTMDPDYIFPPPPLPAFEDEGDATIQSSDSEEHSEQERTPKVEISPLARRRFESMLRGMNGTRAEIARAMEFAVKRADAYDSVIDIICQSLCLVDTPGPKKIARLHLISDILHNSASSLPNVWRYRLGFEKQLPAVFEHFATIHSQLLDTVGTIGANIFLQQADAVVTVWERWFVFNNDVLDTFRRLLHGECTLASLKEEAEQANEAAIQAIQKPSAPKSAGFKSSFKPISLAAAAPTAATDQPAAADGVTPKVEPTNGEDDGDDIDGEDMAEDVDGEMMEDVDGEAMEEDLDGEAM